LLVDPVSVPGPEAAEEKSEEKEFSNDMFIKFKNFLNRLKSGGLIITYDFYEEFLRHRKYGRSEPLALTNFQ